MTAQQTGGLKPTRRTLVKGAAWSVPVVAVGASSAAADVVCSPNSCPPECIDTSFTGQSCKCPGSGNSWGYYLGFCFKNVCSDPNSAPITLTVTALTNNAGKPFDPSVTTPAEITLYPGQEACTTTSWHTSTSSAGKIFIYYSLNGVPQPTPIELPAPPDCAAGTCPTD